MGFWHTGYTEFHEPSGLEGIGYTAPPPLRYFCGYCPQHFAELNDLRRHRFEWHPLRQPALLLRGKPVGALPLIISTPIQPVDVVVEDANRCIVNGNVVEVAQLGAYLAPLTREFVELELDNGGTRTFYVLDFRIPEEEHLAGVEAALLRMARDRVLSLDAVARFVQDCRGFASASRYFDGICHYFYGVMAKEHAPDSGLRPSQYIERYLCASEELSNFDRPVARGIRALVAFHFNQFDEAEALAPQGPLREASGAFASLLQGFPWHFETAFAPSIRGPIEELLTDQDTLQILADASYGLLQFKERSEQLQEHLRRVPAGYDRLKRVLLVCEALAARDDRASHTIARRLARELAVKPDTSAWASAMLERLKTYEQ